MQPDPTPEGSADIVRRLRDAANGVYLSGEASAALRSAAAEIERCVRENAELRARVAQLEGNGSFAVGMASETAVFWRERCDAAKDALREALRSTPETIYTACSLCGDSTFEHVCNDSERPNPLHATLSAALAKLEGP